MNKQKIITAILLAVVLVGTSIFVAASGYLADDKAGDELSVQQEKTTDDQLEKEKTAPDLENEKEIVVENDRFSIGCELQEFEIRGLNEKLIEQLQAVREKGERGAGGFWWQEAIIRGVIDENSRRIDVATAKEIIANSSSFKEILARFEEVQPYPDFGGGSGYSRLEYWLDENGNEMIKVAIEYEGISLITLSEDGSPIIESLFKDIYERKEK